MTDNYLKEINIKNRIKIILKIEKLFKKRLE